MNKFEEKIEKQNVKADFNTISSKIDYDQIFETVPPKKRMRLKFVPILATGILVFLGIGISLPFIINSGSTGLNAAAPIAENDMSKGSSDYESEASSDKVDETSSDLPKNSFTFSFDGNNYEVTKIDKIDLGEKIRDLTVSENINFEKVDGKQYVAYHTLGSNTLDTIVITNEVFYYFAQIIVN